MNVYSYPQQAQQQQPQQGNPQQPPGGINPAMLAYQQRANPGGPSSSTAMGSGMGGINPAMLQHLHQQQQQHPQQQQQQHSQHLPHQQQQQHSHQQQYSQPMHPQAGGGINPSQLLANGGGGRMSGMGGGMAAMGASQSMAGMAGMGGMNAGNFSAGNGGGGNINPSTVMNGIGPSSSLSQQNVSQHQQRPPSSQSHQSSPTSYGMHPQLASSGNINRPSSSSSNHNMVAGAPGSPPNPDSMNHGNNSGGGPHYNNPLFRMTPHEMQMMQQKAMLQKQATMAGAAGMGSPMGGGQALHQNMGQQYYSSQHGQHPQQHPQNYPAQHPGMSHSQQSHHQQGNSYPQMHPQAGGSSTPHPHSQPQSHSSHMGGGAAMMPPPRPNTAMSSSSHHSSTSHPPPSQAPHQMQLQSNRGPGTPGPAPPQSAGGQHVMGGPGMPMGPGYMQHHPGQPARPSTSLSSQGSGGSAPMGSHMGHGQQQDMGPPPPSSISRPGTAASMRQGSLGPHTGTPIGTHQPQQQQMQGQSQPFNNQGQQQQRERSHPPSRPLTAQSFHGNTSGAPRTPTSAQGYGPPPGSAHAESPTTPAPGSAGGSLQNAQRGVSVPLPSGQMNGIPDGQRSATVAPNLGQPPMNMMGMGSNPMSQMAPNMNMGNNNPGMNHANGTNAHGMKYPSHGMGGMPQMANMAGMGGANMMGGAGAGMMPPPSVPRQGSIGPPTPSQQHSMMPPTPTDSSGFQSLANGVDGSVNGVVQNQRHQSPHRPMQQSSAPSGMGTMGMGMNPAMQQQQKALAMAAMQQQAGPVGMGIGGPGVPAMQPPFSNPAATLAQQQQRIPETPPRTGTAAGTERGSVPPAPHTPISGPGMLGGPVGTVPPPMTPTHPGTSGGVQAPVLSQTPSRSAGSGGPGGAPGSAGTATSGASGSSAPILPPLPSNVRLNPAITRMTAVPLSQSDALIPPISADEIVEIKKWMEADRLYEAQFNSMRERTAAEVKRSLHGSRPRWWEFDPAVDAAMSMKRKKETFKLEYPTTAVKESAKKRGKRREGLKIPGKLKPTDESREEQLVPIRLEFDVEHQKYRDTFVWNLNDPIVTPEIFAQSIVDDYGLSSSYHSVITKSIQEQLSDYKAHSALLAEADGGILDVDEYERHLLIGQLDDSGVRWWDSWRSRLRNKDGCVRTGTFLKHPKRSSSRSKKRRKACGISYDADTDTPMDVDMFDLDEDKMHEEMRIVIKLDITVGSVKLDDQFEWDIRNTDPTPEQFAEVYCDDLGLTGDFRTSIAHLIREQVNTYQKSLFLVGHPSDGSAIQDDDLRQSFLPTVTSVARSVDQTQMMQPIINYLSDGELERIDKERERELNKRRKRATRGRRGINLPDREALKTQRTPAIGFPEVDPSTLAAVAAASAPTARRAAAAAASLTIANMVASENGTAIIQPSQPILPQAPTLPLSKIPKARGSFKAPSYSQSILKKRVDESFTIPSSTMVDVSTLGPPLEGDNPLPPLLTTAPTSAPDPRSTKGLTVRRQRELEREAKEKEYADGQRSNLIGGVWHCSNCGCPENIAIGRRKGPLGDKTQCGACGKFWHRHRRPRPVEYSTEAEYHINLKLESERAKSSGKKRGGAAALRALSIAQEQQLSTPASSTMEVDASPTVPINEDWVDLKSPKKMKQSPSNEAYEILDRPLSPTSSISSSASEKPLAQTVLQANGAGSRPPASAPDAQKATSETSAPADALVSGETTPVPADSATAHPTDPQPLHSKPQWLSEAVDEIRTRFPDDKFDVVMKVMNGVQQGWRIKCLDCPGKLYTPGPGETLSNYEVHLRNRQHRAKVQARLTETTNA